MIISVLLILAWLVLLLKYPLKALPVSLGALLGLGLIAAWVLWQEHRETSRLAHLELELLYAPAHCPVARPLSLKLLNQSERPLQDLRWEIAAYAPGSALNLVQSNYDAPRYRGPGDLLPGKHWQTCLPLPPLRPGYRPETLEFRAERLQGHFKP
ncbi:multidrug transporter [Stutzerimonas kirkiae]|uniref:multidrug transporter n=1 Tax=Stutzerimonas kirkiae TaxID=2211392 RepID=UPI0010384361|nr:multidrug transporter [Stutzerimonas kirkiae]TBV16193.1 multidrug transporter [Stutzerimonas kirkiae]